MQLSRILTSRVLELHVRSSSVARYLDCVTKFRHLFIRHHCNLPNASLGGGQGKSYAQGVRGPLQEEGVPYDPRRAIRNELFKVEERRLSRGIIYLSGKGENWRQSAVA